MLHFFSVYVMYTFCWESGSLRLNGHVMNSQSATITARAATRPLNAGVNTLLGSYKSDIDALSGNDIEISGNDGANASDNSCVTVPGLKCNTANVRPPIAKWSAFKPVIDHIHKHACRQADHVDIQILL